VDGDGVGCQGGGEGGEEGEDLESWLESIVRARGMAYVDELHFWVEVVVKWWSDAIIVDWVFLSRWLFVGVVADEDG
jgi:hypothetical protein